jgi:hypothetical protein
MRALLDVNVLIALLDADHVHHLRAREWLQANIAAGWASCAITQNGCIRIMAHSSYPGGGLRPSQIASRLTDATAQLFHQYWSEAPSLLSGSLVSWEYIIGSRQVTDAYLLALAVHHGGRLVTFDHGISRRVVPAATDEHLVLL